MPGMGLTNYPNQYEVNKSDIEKINEATRLNKQQHELLQKQKSTTPNVNSAEALDKIGDSFHDRWKKAAPKIAEELKAQKAAEKAAKEKALKKASENLNPWDISTSYTLFGNKLTGKSNSESSEGEKNTYKGGNPNGDLDVDLSNTNPKDGWRRLDKESEKPVESSAPVKEEPTSTPTTTASVSKPKAKAKSTGFRRNPDLANDGKTKEWYENLANSSYANDKEHEADMKAFRKMQADEIAKNGYYTDSQGVKVYAKAMTDKPKKENNNE